jgi:hypothetical protein
VHGRNKKTIKTFDWKNSRRELGRPVYRWGIILQWISEKQVVNM